MGPSIYYLDCEPTHGDKGGGGTRMFISAANFRSPQKQHSSCANGTPRRIRSIICGHYHHSLQFANLFHVETVKRGMDMKEEYAEDERAMEPSRATPSSTTRGMP